MSGPRHRAETVELTAVGVAAAAAAAAFHPVFGVAAVLAPSLLGAASGVATALLARRVASPATAPFLPVVGAVVTVAAVLWPPLPGPSTWPEVLRAVGEGWARLLEADLPAPAEPALLVPVVLAAWVAAFLGAGLALGSRSVAAPVLPALVALIAAVAYGVGGASWPLAPTAVALGAAATLLAVRGGAPLRAAARGLVPVAAIVVAVTVAVPATGVLADRRPYDVRRLFLQPLEEPRRPAATTVPPVTTLDESPEQLPVPIDTEPVVSEEPGPGDEGGAGPGLPLWVVVAVLVASVTAAAVGWRASLPARRRWVRRRRDDPGERVLGALDEVADELARRGEPVPGRTAAELVAMTGEPSLAPLAELADAVAFGDGRTSHEQADELWRAVERWRRTGAGRAGARRSALRPAKVP